MGRQELKTWEIGKLKRLFLKLFQYYNQWDHKGPELRTWSGSGPMCQKGTEKVRILASGPDFFLRVFCDIQILMIFSKKGLDFA